MPIIKFGNADIYDLRRASGFPARDMSIVDTISIHHWAGGGLPETASVQAELDAIERIRAMHTSPVPRFGWADYAYHFTVFASGRVYYTGDLHTQRAVVGGQNHKTTGVALPGDFTDDPPSDRHLRAVRAIVGEILLEMDGWSADRRKRGAMVRVVPHKAYGGTSCPGDTWDRWRDAVVINPPEDAGNPDQRQQDADLIEQIAGEHGISPVDLLALAIAEAEPMPGRLIHPWSRRPADPALDPVKWPDVSAGAWHQTVRYSPEYLVELLPEFGGAYPGGDHTERILALYLDPAHAGRVAAAQLAEWLNREDGDFVRAASRYNKPGTPPEKNPARKRYAECYPRAQAIWAELGR